MLELLKKLLEIPAISGYEDPVREFIKKEIPSALPTTTDNMGNLVATMGVGKKSMMFSAHMDELGFVVTEIMDSGFLRIRPVGGTDPRTLFGRALWIVTEKGKIPGVISVIPVHLMQDRAKETAFTPPITDFFVDVGASSKKEAEKLGINLLDFGTLQKHFNVLNKKFISCRGLDNRMGCVVLLEAMKRLARTKLKWNVHFAFSVQEEIGVRGAELLSRKYELDVAFAIDSASASDFPSARSDLSTAKLGRGPGLRVIDRVAMMPRKFTKELQALAKKVRIPCQIVATGGSTDARTFQVQGARTMPIAVPLRYTHTAVEMIHMGDLEDTVKFVVEIVKHYAGRHVD